MFWAKKKLKLVHLDQNGNIGYVSMGVGPEEASPTKL
jgi:hypothetical protein